MRHGRRPRSTEMLGHGAPAPLLLCLLLACAAAEAGIDWHESLEAALEAAGESGKPLLVFVYIGGQDADFEGQRQQIHLPGSEEDRARQRVQVSEMLNDTLVDPGVVHAAEAFEAVRLDLRLRCNDAARRRLHISPGVDPATGVRAGMYPITLFLDSNGDELFRRHGSLPPVAYQLQLERAANLFAKLDAVAAQPGDAVARRELGRAYMEMDFAPDDPFYRAAVRNLEKAIELDPDNATGAKYDARVDLAILHLPDDPGTAVGSLFQLQVEDPDGRRRLEIQYYMAVAQYVLEHYDEAIQLLAQFETEDRDSPYYDSPWTPQALGLLAHIRARQGG